MVKPHAKDMWEAFPDLFLRDPYLGRGRKRYGRRAMADAGTNTGPFKALPPTNRSISERGAEFIWIEGDKIRTVQG